MEGGKDAVRFKKIIKMFEDGNVCVCGLRGRGKDLLFGNVIARRKKPYVSNMDYTKGEYFTPYRYRDIDCGGNTYDNLIKNEVLYYKCPYEYGTDVYLSDCGIYYPSQYCNELNKKYPSMAMYQALSRQINRGNFHVNMQNLGRCFDKIREMSDVYITCEKCIYIPLVNIVLQVVTLYDKASSCQDRVRPCRVKVPLLNKEAQTNADIYRDKFFNTYGSVKRKILIYHNKSKHDTYHFEKLFKEGKQK